MLPHNTHITTPLPPPTQVALAPLSSPLTYSPRSTNPLATDNKVYGIGATISTSVSPTAPTANYNSNTTTIGVNDTNNNLNASTINAGTNTATNEKNQTLHLAPSTLINTEDGTTNVIRANSNLKPT